VRKSDNFDMPHKAYRKFLSRVLWTWVDESCWTKCWPRTENFKAENIQNYM